MNTINYTLNDNSVQTWIPFNAKKQQLFLLPKEESQAFQSKHFLYAPGNILFESEDTRTRAFMQRLQIQDARPADIYPLDFIDFSGSRNLYSPYFPTVYGANTSTPGSITLSPSDVLNTGTPLESFNNYFFPRYQQRYGKVADSLFDVSLIVPNDTTFLNQNGYQNNKLDVNAPHTPTDWIGSSMATVDTLIDPKFATVYLLDMTTGDLTPFYLNNELPFKNIRPGVQLLNIPLNRFSTILTDPAEIKLNGGSNIKYNYGDYTLFVMPNYIETTVQNFNYGVHMPWELQISENISNVVSTTTSNQMTIQNINNKFARRSVTTIDKTPFFGTNWNFEYSPLSNNTVNPQAGRLWGATVEIWDSTKTILKGIKNIAENELNLDNTSDAQVVINPDIKGYDSPHAEIATGDILRIYPHDTWFDSFNINISFPDQGKSVYALLKFMLNDAVRDMKNGIIDIYDDAGVSVDPTTGQLDGNVIQEHQITQFNNFEIRKRIK